MIQLIGQDREECRVLRDGWYATWQANGGEWAKNDLRDALIYMRDVFNRYAIPLPTKISGNEYRFDLKCGILFTPDDIQARREHFMVGGTHHG